MAIKRNRSRAPLFLFLLIFLVFAGFGCYYGWTHLSRNVAIQTVKEFYNDEQGGDYGSAWTLLHSEMKKKFNQSEYIKQRTTLFIESFGVKTFSYKIDGVDHLKKWRMTKDSDYIKDVYKVTIIQSFIGIFGAESLTTDVYVTKEKNVWKILWQY